MQSRTAPSPRKRFVRSVILLNIGLIAAAALAAWLLRLDFGLVLLVMGGVVGGGGAYLGAPDPTDPDNPRNIPFAFVFRPNERQEDVEAYDAEHTVPTYAFENVVMYAGMIAFLVSLPFVAYTLFAR